MLVECWGCVWGLHGVYWGLCSNGVESSGVIFVLFRMLVSENKKAFQIHSIVFFLQTFFFDNLR